jgi:hypothetical protein
MIRKKTLGLMAVIVLILIIAVPVVAAEKTFQMDIPGCGD